LKLAYSLPAEEVKPWLEDLTRPPHARAALHGALDLVPRWDRLILVLRLSRSGALVGLPTGRLSRWLSAKSRDLSGPTEEQWRNVDAELAIGEAYLRPGTVNELRAELDHWAKLKRF
jgi:hypothetical protein